jgi:signal peptidase II
LLNKYKAAIIITPALALADQAAKAWIVANLLPGRPITMARGILELRYAENPGIAFSLLQNLPEHLRLPLFAGINLLAALIMLRLLVASPPANRRIPAALSLILAGALGNLIDRFRWGVVIDFIRVTLAVPFTNMTWPIFNLADVFISTGIALLLLDALLAGGPVRESAPEADEAPADPPAPVTEASAPEDRVTP